MSESDLASDELRSRLQALMRERGWTLHSFARKAGMPDSTLRNFIGGATRSLGYENLSKLAKAANTTVAALTGSAPPPNPPPPGAYEAAPRTNVAAADVPFPAPASLPRDVPVLGTAVGGQDRESGGDFLFNGDVIDHVRRPPGIAAMRDVFAFYVIGTSMEPWRRDGGLAYVTPRRPLRAGDHALIELHPTRDGEAGAAMVKRFVGRTPTKLRLAQYNPAREFDVDAARVKNIYRIAEWEDLIEV